jgi:hypothetical protein
VEFAAYRTDGDGKPTLHFRLDEINDFWEILMKTLSPRGFQKGRDIIYKPVPISKQQTPFDYKTRPLVKEITVKKRAAKRHFGVHGYFTKQTWNVVAEYIKNFSQPGDLILDPYGGSGVTAVEALINDRRAINIDINPLAIFLVEALLVPVKQDELCIAYQSVINEYIQKAPNTDAAIERILKTYKGIKNLPLLKGSDVTTVYELFSRKQIAQLSLLRHIIKKQNDKNIRQTLMLMFSGLVTRLNLTYHTSKAVMAESGFGGDAAAMRYFRYRIAPNPVNVDVVKCMELRYQAVLNAKKEIEMQCLLNTQKTVEDMLANAQIIKGTATD